MTAADTHRAIDAVWRIESARLIAGLARIVRDVGLAEELAQDALVAALEQWPESGVPDNPGAWLMATAKHRAIDLLRRHERRSSASTRSSAATLEARQEAAVPDLDAALDDDIGDDLLRLIFTACHPVLSTEARVALTLRLLGGLTTDEIARAFLVPEPTVAQRIVRAKRTLAEARVPFEVPRGRRARRPAVVGARGHLPHLQRGLLGDRRRRLDAARRSARTRCASAASSPSSRPASRRSTASSRSWRSRRRARARASGPSGEPVLLLDQDRARWDQLLIRRGLAALARAESARRRARPVRAAGRDRRLPRARARRRRRPTGRASPRSTTSSPASRRRPSSS